MEKNKLFSLPKIHRGKLWYISFYYKNNDGINERFRIKEGLNSIHSIEAREIEAQKIQEKYYKKLLTGWHPNGASIVKSIMPQHTTLMGAIDEAVIIQKNTIANFAQWHCRIKPFIAWCGNNNLLMEQPNKVTSSDVFRFLNYIQNKRKLHPRTRNNFLSDISSLFSIIKKLQIIQVNPCEGISKLNARSTQHKAYTDADMVRIKNWIDKNDPYLGLFIKFIMMGLRRVEVVRLQLGNFDLENGLILLPSKKEKTNRNKVKIIFKKWRGDFINMELDKYPSNYYFFTHSKQPGLKMCSADWFTDKFKILKKALNFDRSYTLYGFRHTTAINLFKGGADLKDIMNITGHTSLQAFQVYIQQYLNEPPKDVSDKLNFNF